MSPVAEAIPSIAGLPEPEGAQTEVVTLRPEGHAVILGASGSGKTVLAVLRALYLSDPEAAHAGRTLLVTYNKALLAYLNHLIPEDASNLDACTYHQFAREYLKKRGKIKPGWTVLGNHKMGLVKQALEEVRKKSDEEILKRPTGFFVPELDWMAQNGYLTEESYLQAKRTGRGEDLSEAARKVVFQIQEAYLRLRGEVGKHYDWADMAAAVHSALKEDDREREYTHVVVDEGQDFSPEMLRSLVLAIPRQGGSLTLFGDTSQQIYGRGINWRTAGLEVSDALELTKNHRNSPQIAKLASAIAEMPYFISQPDVVAASEFAEPGPKPALVTFADQKSEDAFVVKKAKALAAEGSVGVLCRRDADAVRIGEQFESATHLHRDMPVWQPGPGISYGNVHSAKGYEFDSVILVGVTKGKWPERRMASAIGRDQAAVMDGRLLHVAVSRARQNLLMTATRDLTPLLPKNEGLWTEHEIQKKAGEKKSGEGAGEKRKAAAGRPKPAAENGKAPRDREAPAKAAPEVEAEPEVEVEAEPKVEPERREDPQDGVEAEPELEPDEEPRDEAEPSREEPPEEEPGQQALLSDEELYEQGGEDPDEQQSPVADEAD